MVLLMKTKLSQKLIQKLKIKNTLTLPKTVLQMLLENKLPPKSSVKDALNCIDDIVEILSKI